mgnify:CR=1 FL=1
MIYILPHFQIGRMGLISQFLYKAGKILYIHKLPCCLCIKDYCDKEIISSHGMQLNVLHSFIYSFIWGVRSELSFVCLCCHLLFFVQLIDCVNTAEAIKTIYCKQSYDYSLVSARNTSSMSILVCVYTFWHH